MAKYWNTRDDLTERICRIGLGEWYGGLTTSAGTTTTFVDNKRPEEDDFFNNMDAWVYFPTGGTPGHEGKVSDWVLSTTTGTFAPAAGTAPGNGARYHVHVNWRIGDIHEAINAAVESTWEDVFLEVSDETSIVFQDTVYEYPVPEKFNHIYRLTMGDASNLFGSLQIPPDQYRINRGTAIPVIHFYNDTDNIIMGDDHSIGNWWANITLTAGRYLRIEGLAVHPKLENDADVCQLDPDFILAHASALLHMAKITGSDPDVHAAKAQAWQGKADLRLRRIKTKRLPNMKRVR